MAGHCQQKKDKRAGIQLNIKSVKCLFFHRSDFVGKMFKQFRVAHTKMFLKRGEEVSKGRFHFHLGNLNQGGGNFLVVSFLTFHLYM